MYFWGHCIFGHMASFFVLCIYFFQHFAIIKEKQQEDDTMLHFPEEIIRQYENTKPAYDKVYNILRDCVMNDYIAPNAHLTEISVSEALDVSRTPVRAALQKLRSEGILSSDTRRTGNAKQLSRKEREDLLIYDCMLEGLAARLAARERDQDLISALEDVLQTMERLYQKYQQNYDQAPGMRDLTLQFHLILAKASKNKFLYKTVVEVRTIMRQHQTSTENLRQTGGREQVLRRQREILECIKAGDEMGAEILARADIYAGKNIYINSQIL